MLTEVILQMKVKLASNLNTEGAMFFGKNTTFKLSKIFTSVVY